jgi:hypothetical protein
VQNVVRIVLDQPLIGLSSVAAQKCGCTNSKDEGEHHTNPHPLLVNNYWLSRGQVWYCSKLLSTRVKTNDKRKYARQMDVGNSGKKENVIVKSSKSLHNYFATALTLYSFRNVDQLQ